MNLTEVARQASTDRDRVRYLVDRGYLTPVWVTRGIRKVREFSVDQATLLEAIVRYYDAEGLRWERAYERALRDLEQPRLIG